MEEGFPGACNDEHRGVCRYLLGSHQKKVSHHIVLVLYGFFYTAVTVLPIVLSRFFIMSGRKVDDLFPFPRHSQQGVGQFLLGGLGYLLFTGL